MRNKLDDDVDALFQLPLAEFTGARNALASQLKKSGHANDANIVKTLAKPSVSAWAVNQLYWNHREAFDKLLAAGQRIRQAQTSRLAGKVAEMRGSLNARRDALSDLSDLATSLLSDAGHNPSLDTIRRITTTLEAISARASISDGPTPGRLTQDVDPPGFESFASLFGGATQVPEKPARGTASQKLSAASQKSGLATAKTLKQTAAQDRHQFEQMRRARIAEAKDALQDAKRSLTQARAKAQRLETAQKNASAQAQEAQAKARQAEKELRQAEERSKKESAASKDAALHAQRLAAEAKEAAQAVNEANRGVEKARKELESLFQES